MKQGSSIEKFAEQLYSQAKTKRDFVVDTRSLRLHTSDTGRQEIAVSEVEWSPGENRIYEITDHASKQIAARLGIPTKYFQRMAEDATGLLEDNVNHWFKTQPERRMIRTIDNKARAFLSDRYRRIDNDAVFNMVFPILQEIEDMKIVSCDVSDSRMYLKALFPRIRDQVSVGDEVQSGLVISNGEVGNGSVKVEPLIYRLICLNGMIIPDHSISRRHIGAHVGSGDGFVEELYRDETIEADDKALLMKIEDVVRSATTELTFHRAVNKMKDAKENTPISSPIKAIEVLSNRFGFTEEEQNRVLIKLVSGSDISQYGVMNAVTAASATITDYDRATQFERFGGQVLMLESSEWDEVALAA